MSEGWGDVGTSTELTPAAAKRLKETFKSKEDVLPAVTRHVMRTFDSEDQRAQSSLIHPSDMAKKDWCIRADYYRITGTATATLANPSFGMSNILTNGVEIHDKYQGWFWEMGKLFGEFQCIFCGHTWTALSPERCPKGHDRRFLTYREVTLNRGGLITGHADAALHDLDGYTGLVEIKSIGIGTLRFEAPDLHDAFQDGKETLDTLSWKINRPFPSHMRQGQIYLWLAWPRYEKIVFIYETKWNQRVKAYTIEYNPRVALPLVEKARVLEQAAADNELPDRPEWAVDKQVSQCRTCPYRKECWDEPAQDEAPSVRVRKADAATRRSALRKA